MTRAALSLDLTRCKTRTEQSTIRLKCVCPLLRCEQYLLLLLRQAVRGMHRASEEARQNATQC